MAFSQQSEGQEIFNVSHAVGAGAPNFWTDIMLVQTFIQFIYGGYYATGSIFDLTNNEFDDLPDPNKDFKNLKKTMKWIRRYQRDCSKNSQIQIVQDGRVDRMAGFYTPKTKSIYTILYLNWHFGDVRESADGNINWQDSFLENGNIPALLRGEIKASRRK